jgi:hypothetical protein
MPFGVTLPDNFEESPVEKNEGSAPESLPGESGAPPGSETKEASSPEATGEGTQAEQDAATLEQALTDLDKLERFRFAGKEWTPKELAASQMLQSDYTRKTKEVAENRKYVDNFAADLQTVLRTPSEWAKFQRIYPEEYVKAARHIIDSRRASTPEQGAAPKPVDPQEQRLARLEGMLNRHGETLTSWEKAQQAAEVQKTEAWLDNQFESCARKYPLMQSTYAQTTARSYIEAAHLSGTEITDKVIDRVFKTVNDEITAAWEKHYKGKVESQLKAGSKARDVGAGGAIPSAPPKTAKNFKEANRMLDEHLDNLR